jgi:hypothetical protein
MVLLRSCYIALYLNIIALPTIQSEDLLHLCFNLMCILNRPTHSFYYVSFANMQVHLNRPYRIHIKLRSENFGWRSGYLCREETDQ